MQQVTSGRESGSTPNSGSQWTTLRPYLYAVPALGVVFAVLAFVVSKSMSPTYTADGRVFLDTSAQLSGQQAQDIVRLGQTQAALLTSNMVFGDAGRTLGISEATLRKSVKAVFASEAAYITVSANARRPDEATLRVVAVERAFERASGAQRQAQFVAAASSLRDLQTNLGTQLNIVQRSLQSSPSDARLLAQQAALSKQMSDVADKLSAQVVAQDTAGTGVSLFEAPLTPKDPSSPRAAVAAEIAFLFGALLGGAATWVVTGRRARRSEPVIESSDMPALGWLPPANASPKPTVTEDTALALMLELPSGARTVALVPIGDYSIAPCPAEELAAGIRFQGQRAFVLDSASAAVPMPILDRPPAEGLPRRELNVEDLAQSRPDEHLATVNWSRMADVDQLFKALRELEALTLITVGELSKLSTQLVLSRSDAAVLIVSDVQHDLETAATVVRHRCTSVLGYMTVGEPAYERIKAREPKLENHSVRWPENPQSGDPGLVSSNA